MLISDAPPAAVAPAPPVAANTQIIGVMATGPQADLDRLEAMTTGVGFPSQQMDGPEGHELAVAFPPNSDPAKIAAYLDDLRSGKFAALTFRSAVAPPQ